MPGSARPKRPDGKTDYQADAGGRTRVGKNSAHDEPRGCGMGGTGAV